MTRRKDSMGLSMACSWVSTGTAVAIFNPLDCLRIRWQVAEKASRASLIRFGQKIVQNEGLWGGLWRHAIFTNPFGIGMTGAFRIGAYPTVRDATCKFLGREKTPTLMFVSGFMCGMSGFWIATPMFQMKTRLQAEAGLPNPQYRHLFNGLPKIYREEGE